jgi:hypothetical protein
MNSYGHPHPEVLQRYAELGLPVQRTDQAGALLWRDQHPGELQTWRAQQPHYWQLPWPEARLLQPAVQARPAAGEVQAAQAGAASQAMGLRLGTMRQMVD